MHKRLLSHDFGRIEPPSQIVNGNLMVRHGHVGESLKLCLLPLLVLLLWRLLPALLLMSRLFRLLTVL